MTGVAQTTVKVGVIGLGHVGLPSAVGFAKLYVTDIETGIDRCEARDAGPRSGHAHNTGVFHEVCV